MLTANLDWTITDELDVPDALPAHHKKQLVAGMLNHIYKRISQPIQQKRTSKVTEKPKDVLDQMDRDEILELIDETFKNFLENYGRTPKILFYEKDAENLFPRVLHVLQSNN